MVQTPYSWPADLLPHTARKHRILTAYFDRYLRVRCKWPARAFKVAIMDGFAGGGRYTCGSPGSPLIFIEGLRATIDAVNIERVAQDLPPIDVRCHIHLNDADPEVVALLRTNVAPSVAELAGHPHLKLDIDFSAATFERAVPHFLDRVDGEGFKNLLFNLDQCGHSQVDLATLRRLTDAAPSVEIFYTFMVKALLAYLNQRQPEKLLRQLRPIGVTSLDHLDEVVNKEEWLARVEVIVFETLKGLAPFASPFSINNPDGWRYWLIHLAKSSKARQVYNDVLHANATSQAHFGRAGLNMLSYDPSHDGALYLFEADDRERARSALADDIPRVIAAAGDRMTVENFYNEVYNLTPAHNDDINQAMLDNPDLQVLTPAGRQRRVARTIGSSDVISLKRQRSFFSRILRQK